MTYFRYHAAAPADAEMIDYVDPRTRQEFAVLAEPDLINEARARRLRPKTRDDAALEARVLGK